MKTVIGAAQEQEEIRPSRKAISRIYEVIRRAKSIPPQIQ